MKLKHIGVSVLAAVLALACGVTLPSQLIVLL